MASLPHKTQDSQHLVRGILKTMLQVEDEAAAIKSKVGRTSNWPAGRVRLDPVIGEDMAVALEVIQRVKEEQAEEERLKKYKFLQEKKPLPEYDPRTGMEERHRALEEKRKQRKQMKALGAQDYYGEPKKSSRDVRSSTDNRLTALRQRQKELEVEIDPEALRVIKEEVKREAAEMRELDLAVRRQKAQMDEMQKIQQAREELAKEKDERLKHIRELHAKQLLDRVQTVLENSNWKLGSWGLRRLCDFSLDLKSKEMKFQSRFKVIRKARSWAFWRKIAKESQVQRQLKAFEEEQAQERLKYDRAVAFEKSWKLRRILLDWLKTAVQIRVEREEEQEAEARRKKIDKMMKFVKHHTEPKPPVFNFEAYEDEEEEDKIEEPQAALVKPKVQLRTQSQAISIVSEPRRHEPTYVEVNQESIYESTSRSEGPGFSSNQSDVQVPSTEFSQKSVSEVSSTASRKSSKVDAMKAREEERKRRREALEAKYKAKQEEELQKKREAELKTLEDEKQRKREVILKKKQAELEKRQKEEAKMQEALRIKQLTELAVGHRRRTLAINYVFKGLANSVKSSQAKMLRAEAWNDRKVGSWGLSMLAASVLAVKQAKEQEEAQREMEAWFVHLEHLQKLVLRGFKQMLQRRRLFEEQAEIQYSEKLKQRTIRRWHDSSLRAAAEAAMLEQRAAGRIESFRKWKLCRKALRCWQEDVEESREEREKATHAEEMWSKVKSWLGEVS
mmetsp:Transcript_1211/g.2978  ORF Transcript_1211/g.2978 Transcript_1211/m.2978 type:complete len:731 (+) Transcript_1211:3-2195(+)